MSQPDLIPAIRGQLVADGIARDPRVAGPLPPCWAEPRDGIPAPGESSGTATDAGVVLGLLRTGGIPAGPGEGYSRRETVDVVVRSLVAPPAREIERQVLAVFAPPPYGTRSDWVLADGLRVIESRAWRALQPITVDDQAITSVFSLLLETYA